MKIERIEQKDKFWRKVIDYAEHCSWQGGKYLAEDMEKNFSDWECVFAAVEKGKIAGYCAVLKRDCINDVPYTPYIGYVFVEEDFRGKRLSQELLQNAESYLKEQGFPAVYIVSHFDGFYEKYGYEHIDTKRLTGERCRRSTDMALHREYFQSIKKLNTSELAHMGKESEKKRLPV